MENGDNITESPGGICRILDKDVNKKDPECKSFEWKPEIKKGLDYIK